MNRGWVGPNICVLCGCEAESVNHLFVDCSFGYMVWKEVAQHRKILLIWDRPNLSLNLWQWHSRDCGFIYVPVFFCWSLWNIRNRVILKTLKPSPYLVFVSIIGLLNDFPVPEYHIKHVMVGDPPALKYPVASLMERQSTGLVVLVFI